MVAISVLDLAFIPEGATPGDALRNSAALARHVEALGYRRFWLAEHHNMVGIASAATSVVIGHVAAATSTIRVGAGGIMLPNHSPLVIAEQFGTLEALYPGRIDLGLGRAPGTDQRTLRALRRGPEAADQFPQDVLELQAFFAPEKPGQVIRAVPGAGLNVPIWILGSSLFGARLAAMLGLPYAFASHFAPDALLQALKLYRAEFRAEAGTIGAPHAMVGISAFVADTEAEARRLFTSSQQQFTNLIRGRPGRLQPPIDDIDTYWSPDEKAHVERMLACAFVGTPDQVRDQLAGFLRVTRADELIVASPIYDFEARQKSYTLFADVAAELEVVEV